MMNKEEIKKTAKRIAAVLPKSNCGKCGFANCGEFALAVAEGTASPFGCQEDPSVGYQIREMVRAEVPQERLGQGSYVGYSPPGMPEGVGVRTRRRQRRRFGQGRGMGHGSGRGRGRQKRS
jgi:hypothetical protein